MIGRGTPLRKRGNYRVFLVKNRTHPYIEVRDIRDDSFIGSTAVMASANFCVDRLASGLPMETPQESRDRTLELYAGVKPTRFRYYMHHYLGGMRWMNGGLLDDDLTDYTREGKDKRRAKMNEDHDLCRFGLDPKVYPDRLALEEEETRRAYAEGQWPDADEPDDPAVVNTTHEWYRSPNSLGTYHDEPLNPRSPLGVLASSREVIPVLPEWIEDARIGMQLALRYGVDDPHGFPMLPVLRRWADILGQRYGGNWFPDLTVPGRLRVNPERALEAQIRSLLSSPTTG